MVHWKNWRISLRQMMGGVAAIAVILGWSADRSHRQAAIKSLREEVQDFKESTKTLRPQFLSRRVRVWRRGSGVISHSFLVRTHSNGIMDPWDRSLQLKARDKSPVASVNWRFLGHLDGRDLYLFAVRPGVLVDQVTFDSPEETITYVAYEGGRCKVLEYGDFRVDIIPSDVWSVPDGL